MVNCWFRWIVIDITSKTIIHRTNVPGFRFAPSMWPSETRLTQMISLSRWRRRSKHGPLVFCLCSHFICVLYVQFNLSYQSLGSDEQITNVWQDNLLEKFLQWKVLIMPKNMKKSNGKNIFKNLFSIFLEYEKFIKF